MHSLSASLASLAPWRRGRRDRGGGGGGGGGGGEAGGAAADPSLVRHAPRIKLLDFGVAAICREHEALEALEVPGGSGTPGTPSGTQPDARRDGAPAVRQDDSLLKTTGTPAFYAPEMCVKGAYHGAPPGPPHTRRLPPPAASPRAASHPARRAASRPARRAGRAADVWAAGVTLCMLAGGKLPFEADNMPEARPPNSKALPGSPPRRAPPRLTPHLAPPPPCPSECSGKRV